MVLLRFYITDLKMVMVMGLTISIKFFFSSLFGVRFLSVEGGDGEKGMEGLTEDRMF